MATVESSLHFVTARLNDFLVLRFLKNFCFAFFPYFVKRKALKKNQPERVYEPKKKKYQKTILPTSGIDMIIDLQPQQHDQTIYFH